MESLLDSQHGTSTLLAGLIVVLCLHVFMQFAKFLFEIIRKKNETSEKNIEGLMQALRSTTETMQRLDHRINAIERDLNTVLKFKIDFRKLFAAVKFIAGEKWPDAKKEMKDFDIE